jgi:hypothetical protein
MINFFARLPLWLLLISCLWGIACKNVAAAAPENQIKAAYLIHLSEFTTWPDEKMQPASFSICIASDSQLREPLEELKGRLVKNRQFNILYDIPIDKLNSCHVFYVEYQFNQKIFQQSLLKTDPILTVSSEADFAKGGGAIEYYRDVDKIRMRVNLKKLGQLKLMISSKLLRLMDSDL